MLRFVFGFKYCSHEFSITPNSLVNYNSAQSQQDNYIIIGKVLHENREAFIFLKKMFKYIIHFSNFVRKNRNSSHLGWVQFDSQGYNLQQRFGSPPSGHTAALGRVTGWPPFLSHITMLTSIRMHVGKYIIF